MSDQQHEDGDDEISDRETQAALRRGTRDGSPELPLSFFEQLPKTDLHVHLDGSLRLSTIIELAKEYGVELPSTHPAELSKALNLGQNCGSLVEYLKAFDITLAVLQDEEALRRAAYELAEDAARENVRYMEVRYSPILHTRKGASLTRIVESVIEGLADARRDHGITCNVIICGIRHIEPQQSLRLAEVASAYKNKGVCGFDLAGAEYDYPAKQHRDAFYLVRNNNVRSTIHAGEAYGPESIHQAIHVCGAHRIGHGTRLREDGDLLNYVTDQRVPLEVCLSSNVQTQAVRDFASHPLGFYFDFGVRVTINTDNRLITNTTVSKELWLCHTELAMPLSDIKSIILAGLKSSFLPFHIKQAYLRQVSQDLTRFRDDGQILPPTPPSSSRPGTRNRPGVATPALS
jgi:adenosine deaminase